LSFITPPLRLDVRVLVFVPPLAAVQDHSEVMRAPERTAVVADESSGFGERPRSKNDEMNSSFSVELDRASGHEPKHRAWTKVFRMRI
jgi:hypothetical protein